MKKCWFVLLALCCLAVGVGFPCGRAQADTITWNTTAGDWHTAGSWSPAQVPTTGDDVFITSAGASVLLTNSTAVLKSLVLSKTLMFTNWNTTLTASNVTVQSGGIITLPAAFTNNQMSNNVTIVCTNLTIAAGGSINVDSNGYAGGGNSGKNGNGPGGGLVDIRYPAYQPPPDGYQGGGGGHGGRGGNGYNTLSPTGLGGIDYDEAAAPVAPGSGGGWGDSAPYPGGAGGGAVRIQASGVVTVNGTITARGASTPQYCGGGGAGGSIYITCRTFSGNNGVVNADGGSVYPGTTVSGGGGGGRIAVIYDMSAQASVPAVQFSALPGTGWRDGVLGTVYFPGAQLMSETPNINGRVLGFSAWSPNSLTISNVWVRFAADGFQLTVTNNLVVNGSSTKLDLGGNTFMTNYPVTFYGYPAYYAYQWNRIAHASEMANRPVIDVGGNLTLTNGGSLTVFATVTNATVANYGALVDVAGTLFVAANSYVYPYSQPTNGGSVLFRVGNLVVSTPNAGFNADEKGYFGSPLPNTNAPGYGPGVNGYGPGGGSGITYYGGGGGYGGQGGDGRYGVSSPGGGTYGDSNAPAGPGSGGGGSGGKTAGVTMPGSPGGGLVWVEAVNAITLNGTITANGGSEGIDPLPATTYGAGGSGGGVFLRCKTIGGTGVMTANGGIGYNGGTSGGGGGGGGRIAVWRSVDAFAGSASATNGTGLNPGTPGTIVWGLVPPPGMLIMIR